MANPVVFSNGMFALSSGTPTSSGHLTGTKEVTFSLANEELDDAAMGDIAKTFYPGVQDGGAVTVRLRQDFTASALDSKLYTWWQAKTPLNWKARATKTAVASANPSYIGTKYYLMSFPPMSGAHGVALETTITLRPGSNGSTSGIKRSTTT